MQFSLVHKLLEVKIPTLNLIFFAVMIGGSVLILGSLYLIYDVQVFGERSNTKMDLMMVSITFTVIHIVLTNVILFIFKKMRHGKTTSQNERNTKTREAKDESNLIARVLETPGSILNLIFFAVMMGGSVLILGSLYLIYDVQVFGERSNTKMDLMMVSITFTVIHIALTNVLLFAFKKIRYARTLLQREKEEIAKIDKAKDEFSAMVAHDLKNPLVPIHSYSRMLLQGKFGELTNTQKEKMQVIISGTESMLVLIQDILDTHKAELGQMKLDFQLADLNEMVNNAVEVTQPLAEKRIVTIHNDIKENLEIKVDKHRIEQVLINLIKNAIDFVPKDSGKIRIGLELMDNCALVSVSDNGCGIPKEEIGSIFRKFYQVNTSQNRERGGTGLGLSICKNIVELHNGKIWIESDVEKGTSVKFTLPLTNQFAIKRKNLMEKLL